MTELFRRSDRQPETPAVPAEAAPMVAGREDEQSVVDRHSTFNGKYRSTRNLRVEGQMEGEIECQGTLTVAKDARVKGKVVAQDVTVAGVLEGEITCRGRLQVLPSGRVIGSATAARLSIQEGAYYEGELHMAREEKAKEEKAPVDESRPSPLAEFRRDRGSEKAALGEAGGDKVKE